MPLNGRNWVYIAQLSAGTPVAGRLTRRQGKGDFDANGQRAEENNFILDGVDNNANVVDFYNGASLRVNPPPDALAEFKVQTSDYSAEFGHSAGAVVNASIKSGTNAFHGSAWEYVRNTVFDVSTWDPTGAQPASPYHDNQFGATLGGPILKNKLFFFGDAQATRISYAETGTYRCPTALERTGNLSELLSTSLTQDGNAHQIYYQDPTGVALRLPFPTMTSPVVRPAPNRSLNATALKILSEYPSPNVNGANTYNNYFNTRPVVDNTFQWDARMDYNISAPRTRPTRATATRMKSARMLLRSATSSTAAALATTARRRTTAPISCSPRRTSSPTPSPTKLASASTICTPASFPRTQPNSNFETSQGFGGIPVGPLNGGLPNVSLYGRS